MRKISMKRILSLLCCLALVCSSLLTAVTVSAATEEDIVSALTAVINQKRNAVKQSDLLSAVKALDEAATIDEYFIRHAVDGVYDEDPVEADRLSIPGHDGYVAVTATAGGVTSSVVVKIKHEEENLRVLTKDVYVKGSDTDAFTEDADNNITGYNGTAQKIVIGEEANNINSLTAVEGTFKNAVVMILKNSGGKIEKAAARAYASGSTSTGGFSNLKALVVSDSTVRIGENAFVRGYGLKYVKLPDSMLNGEDKGYIDYQAFGYAWNLENINIPSNVTLGKRAFKECGALEFYEGSSVGYSQATVTNEDYAYVASKANGERVIMTAAQQQTATVSRAATLAQETADNYTFGSEDTADTVKAAIEGSYSAKNEDITASWNDTFAVVGGVPYGILTITGGTKSYDIKYGELTLESNPEVELLVKAAFNSAVSELGNAVTQATLLEKINDAVPYTVTASDYFVYHAVDGVYDKDTNPDTWLRIPGHDGYVSAILNIDDNGASTTYGVVASIPHTEEDMGTLTTDVYSANNTNFTTDASGNITKYTGSAQKIVIPATFTGLVKNLKVTGNDGSRDSTTEVIINHGTNTNIEGNAFRSYGSENAITGGYEKLKALVFSDSVRYFAAGAAARTLTLKYAKLPVSMATTANDDGRGIVMQSLFVGCTKLVNVNIPSNARLKYQAFNAIALQDVYIPSNTVAESANAGAGVFENYRGVGERVTLTYAEQQTATFARAATLAQEAADNYTFGSEDNAETVKNNIVASYSEKNANITANWNDTFTVADGVAYGTLTIKENGIRCEIKYGEKPFASNPEAENVVKAAFDNVVAELGNDITQATLTEKVNAQIAPYTVTVSDYFVYHAVDGVYDEDTNPDTKLEIKGHDGYASAVFAIMNGDELLTNFGAVAVIPHEEENLGVLTTDVYSAGNSNFTTTDGNITAYTGSAQKIVIPASFTGLVKNLKVSGDETFDHTTEVIINHGANEVISGTAFRSYASATQMTGGYAKLKALVLSDSVKKIEAGGIARNLSLEYIKLPVNMKNSNGYKNSNSDTIGENGYIAQNTIVGCYNLKNINIPNYVYFDYNVLLDVAVQDIYLSEHFSKHINGISSYVGTGERVILTYAEQQTATFARAAVLAQEAADSISYNITASNANEALSTITASYTSKIDGIEVDWADSNYTKLYLTLGDSRYTIACNASPLILTMANSATIRTGDFAGLRFTANVTGIDKVSSAQFGMLITPKDYIIGTDFTAEALDAADKLYLDIEQTVWATSNTSYTAVLSDIKQGNYYRYFSARAYADVVYADGSTERIYSDIFEARAYDTAKATNTATETYVDTVDVDKPAVHTSASDWIDTMSGNSDAAADTLRNCILATAGADMSAYTGITHEVSTVAEFNALNLSVGDKVLFERGKIFRIPNGINAVSGVFYGAYGTGEKPYIYGSEKNYAVNTTWTQDENTWYTTVTPNNAFGNEESVGLVVFNNGELAGVLKTSTSELSKNGDFYYSESNNRIYIYSDANPAEKYTSIEIGANSRMFDISGSCSNVTIDNIAMKYNSGYGVVIGDGATNIAVTNCEIGFIGGGYQSYPSTEKPDGVRHGNAVEVWRGCNTVNVLNNWIYQIYDSGYTNQGSIENGKIFNATSITVSGNLIEYCGLASIEYWASSGADSTGAVSTMKNINYTNNIMRFAGFGIGAQRPNIAGYHIYTTLNCSNANNNVFNITGNILDTAKTGSIRNYTNNSGVTLPTVSGNTFMDSRGKVAALYGKSTLNYIFYTPKQTLIDITGKLNDAIGTAVVYR